MALNKEDLVDALQAIFEDVSADKTAAEAASDIADAIHNYIIEAIATVTVPAETFLVSADGGVLNADPIALEGDPDETTGGLS